MGGVDIRFFRPTDVARLRRNQRQIQIGRLLVLLRNVAVLAIVAAGGIWIWRHAQSDARFAVKHIEIDGEVHTPRAAIDRVAHHYVGVNLFQIDIARVQRDLGGVGWISRINIEKKLPDTLRIKITERMPVALLRVNGAAPHPALRATLSPQAGRGATTGGGPSPRERREGGRRPDEGTPQDRLMYIDEEGAAFADLTPAAGDNDLPIITDANGPELLRAIALLRELRAHDREIYSRISEVRPIAPRGFAIFDRQLGAFVYADADNVSAKWRSLYAILGAENHPRIEYADLRFADRVIVRTLETTHAEN
jgi:cell division septal protein FtsQ